MTHSTNNLDLFGGTGSSDFILFSEPLKPLPLKGFAANESLKCSIYSIAPPWKGLGGQLSLPFNLIRIDKRLLLALNGKRLQKTWVVDELCQVSLVNELLQGYLLYARKKRVHKNKYMPALSMLLANLLNALNTSSGLIVPRKVGYKPNAGDNPLNITPRIINQLTEYFASIGLVTLHIGRSNEYDGNASWLTPLDELRIRLTYSKARIVLANGTQAVQLKDSDKTARRLPTGNKQKAEITRLSKPVHIHNKTWLEHRLTYQGKQIVPFVKRIFNNGSLSLGGRFYNDGASYQGLPSRERATLLIDGEQTIELDYKSIHFNLLYAWANTTAPDDPYTVNGYTRDTMKSACLVLLNSEDLTAFKRNVTKSGKRKTAAAIQRYKNKLGIYNIQRTKGLKAMPPIKPKSFKGFIGGMPENTKGDDLLTAIELAHEPIKHYFGVPSIGLKLQYADSEIISLVIRKLEGVPTLPVHDSMICKVSDYQIVLEAMQDAFFEKAGARIAVTNNLKKK